MNSFSRLLVGCIVVSGFAVAGCDKEKSPASTVAQQSQTKSPDSAGTKTSGAEGVPKTGGPLLNAQNGQADKNVVFHTGMCDASGALALSGNRILVANDEDNVLRLYAIDQASGPIDTFDVSDQIGTRDEADLEAVARLGDRVYWIASHGRKSSGNLAPERNKFFATSVTDDGNVVDVQPVGRVYDRLLVDLLATPGLEATGLAEASRLDQQKVPELDPKKAGVNIEGLAAGPDGKTLILGFRNPIPGGKAIVISLLNPAEVVDTGAQAKFGKPVMLDLEGLGIRGLDYSAERGGYLISAGPHDTASRFAIYLWSGKPAEAPKKLGAVSISDFGPEGLVVFPDRREILLVSDDGALMVDGKECKNLDDPNERKFKTTWFAPPEDEGK